MKQRFRSLHRSGNKKGKEAEEEPSSMAVLRRARTLGGANHLGVKHHKDSQHQNRLEKGDMNLVDERNMRIRRSIEYNRNVDLKFLDEKELTMRKEELKMFKSIPKQNEGEQIVAGWPPWLIAVASEALRGWIPRRADTFQKIAKIGQGTYSNVYKAYDKENGKVVAMKKVRFNTREPRSVRFMAREIKVLRRLHHPNVVSIQGLATSRTNMSCSLYLVLDYMDYDLCSVIHDPNITLTEAQVKCCLGQILEGVEHCHRRGVLHRDLKASNLLLDSSGNLKIADFGLATFFQAGNIRRRQQLTPQLVTLWYRSPELLLGATEYGAGVDLWSVGCILGELFTGKPLLPGRTEVEQLHKVFKLCGSPSKEFWQKYKLPHANVFKPQRAYVRSLNESMKDLPQPALDLLNQLLAIDPQARGTASAALKSEFFTAKPVPCDPSSLPKGSHGEDVDPEWKTSKARRSKTERQDHRLNACFRGSSREGGTTMKDESGDSALPFEQQHTNNVRGGCIQNARSSSFGQISKELAASKKDSPLVKTHMHTLSSDSSQSSTKGIILRTGMHELSDRVPPALLTPLHGSRRAAPIFGGTHEKQRVADLSKFSALVAAARNSASGKDCEVSLKQHVVGPKQQSMRG